MLNCSDMQPMVKVVVHVNRGAGSGLLHDEYNIYFAHRDFLFYHAPNLRTKLRNAEPYEMAQIDIDFVTPSTFGRFLEWIYKQIFFDRNLLSVHHGEWIKLWLLAENLGASQVQNELILLLEAYRKRNLFKMLDIRLLHEIYDEALLNTTLIRKYIVNTWDEQIQTTSAKDYPPALLIKLVDSHRGKALVGEAQINPQDYYVDAETYRTSPALSNTVSTIESNARLDEFRRSLSNSSFMEARSTVRDVVSQRHQVASAPPVNNSPRQDDGRETQSDSGTKLSKPTRTMQTCNTASETGNSTPTIPAGVAITRIMKNLLDLPTRRQPDVLRTNFRWDLNLNRSTNRDAWAGTAVGPVNSTACDRCQSEKGPWPQCISIDGYFSGSCTNCHYNSFTKKCSHCELSRHRARFVKLGLTHTDRPLPTTNHGDVSASDDEEMY